MDKKTAKEFKVSGQPVCIGEELEGEYPEDSWVYENLELCNFIDQ